MVEAHKSGDPHLHILVHEPEGPVTKALLEKQWNLGFSHWRLVGADRKAAVYACKYLGKEALTRVRASFRYGQGYAVARITERLSALTPRGGTNGVEQSAGEFACPEGPPKA